MPSITLQRQMAAGTAPEKKLWKKGPEPSLGMGPTHPTLFSDLNNFRHLPHTYVIYNLK
jgi:hypothetical protein